MFLLALGISIFLQSIERFISIQRAFPCDILGEVGKPSTNQHQTLKTPSSC